MMTHPAPIPLARVRGALEATGLLVGVHGALPDVVTGVADDSRLVHPGDLFLAVRGAALDGHAFIPHAAARGAAALMVEDAARAILPALIVRDGRHAAAVAAAAAFETPARALRLVGVTGTNGKTTTVSLLRALLDAPDALAASIGTLGVLVGREGVAVPGGAGLTTPGPVELQRVLRTLVTAGVHTVAMEVSSHSLAQRRVEGLRFAAAVFTNFSRDHLDYHTDVAAYLAAKLRLMEHLASDGTAVVNADDPAWHALPPWPRTLTFGQAPAAAVRAEGVRYGPRGTALSLRVGGAAYPTHLPLIGAFNVANALAAAAAAIALGHPAGEVAARLETVPQVPGRLELLRERPAVLRDYAHTPDALERALAAVRPFTARRLLLVFGCGGDRDRGKRPEMGAIAARAADVTILTSDNPRTEDPERILDDIEAGMGAAPHERIEDRRSAIARALALAAPEDLILLAGKGHETYQLRGHERLPFDERAIVRELLGEGA